MRFRRLYEINTRVWLRELAAQHVIPVADLGHVPPAFMRTWQRWQIDAIWLMGVWQPSPASARIARQDGQLHEEFERALPDYQPDDCIGSPYAIRGYEVADEVGGLPGLLAFRQRLHDAGIGLLLDFVPNHTACDHPWVVAHPSYYVQGAATDHAPAPGAYFQVQTVEGPLYIAHGRDPFFPPWSDTAQLHYGNPEVHQVMRDTLLRIAQWCDGVRCDMAMLCLPDVFTRTWSQPGGSAPADFWGPTIGTVRQFFPDFCFCAEVYWQLEARLHGLGFSLVYDKEFYDALRAGDVARIRARLSVADALLTAGVRFLENHDEARAAACFHVEQHEAAALTILSLPGATLLHDGQCEGRRWRNPVQLRRRRREPVQPRLQRFYERFLALPITRDGTFQPLQVRLPRPGTGLLPHLLAWAWCGERRLWLLVVNYADVPAQGVLDLHALALSDGALQVTDHATAVVFELQGEPLRQQGLSIDLPAFGYHCFEVAWYG